MTCIDKMVLNTGRYFPALRIKEEKMTDEEVFHTFNYAFAAVERVETKGKGRVIHFDPNNEQDLGSWDDFYEQLDEYGQLYVDKTPREEGDFHGYGILYYKEPRPDCWEVSYARKTSPRISTTSTNPRYVPKARTVQVWNRETGKMETLVIPKKIPKTQHKTELQKTEPQKAEPRQCTCACNCGARLGISI